MELMVNFKLVDTETRWMDQAKCRGNKDIVWFPEPGEAWLMAPAKKFCADCPVRERCLRWALDNGIPYGVWGGKSGNERRRLLYARRYQDRLNS